MPTRKKSESETWRGSIKKPARGSAARGYAALNVECPAVGWTHTSSAKTNAEGGRHQERVIRRGVRPFIVVWNIPGVLHGEDGLMQLYGACFPHWYCGPSTQSHAQPGNRVFSVTTARCMRGMSIVSPLFVNGCAKHHVEVHEGVNTYTLTTRRPSQQLRATMAYSETIPDVKAVLRILTNQHKDDISRDDISWLVPVRFSDLPKNVQWV